MKFREASVKDIPALHSVRMSVRENVLNNPLLVTEDDYMRYLSTHGKGWLCELGGEIVGFAIVDSSQNNIWALFVKPGVEKKGIGRILHDSMLDWFFKHYEHTLWLGTAPDTRAAHFYKVAGWQDLGKMKNGEIRFEMTFVKWKELRSGAKG